eukprot:jgi/Botrbrau1/3365/Bobra.0337s0006.1
MSNTGEEKAKGLTSLVSGVAGTSTDSKEREGVAVNNGAVGPISDQHPHVFGLETWEALRQAWRQPRAQDYIEAREASQTRKRGREVSVYDLDSSVIDRGDIMHPPVPLRVLIEFLRDIWDETSF